MSRYLRALEAALADRGFAGRLSIMNSSGGVMSVPAALREPVRTLMSGPVGGVIGTAAIGAAVGADDLIAVDMGGTSFDVSMIRGGQLDISVETQVAGLPITVPSVNTNSVGAGGGSVAWTQAGGMRVGPRSSGAMPGPICYRRGGSEPTVTDANLVLGRLDPDRFLAGGMELDPIAPLGAFDAYGRGHGLSALDAAEGTLAIANSTMADAIREITLWRGVDVADFTLVAYGGAGPMHAALIAEELGVGQVVIPPEPGAFSAWGMLHAGFIYDTAMPVRENLATYTQLAFADASARLKADLRERLRSEAGVTRRPRFRGSVDLRYAGQQYAVRVAVDAPFAAAEVRAAFEAEYQRLYGFASPTARVDILNIRVIASVVQPYVPVLASGRVPALIAAAEALDSAGRGSQPGRLLATFGGAQHDAPVWERDGLGDDPIHGPAVIADPTATIVIPPGWQADADRSGSLILRRDLG